VDQVAAAIADPVRRDVLELLRAGPLAAGDIAARFTISRPAVSRHLRVLREAGLVAADPTVTDGRSRVYRLDPAPLREVDAWIGRFRDHDWSAALDALGTEVQRTRRVRRRARADQTGADQTNVERKGRAV
jgi:DNA-binding transcriptional ArsR family regulator